MPSTDPTSIADSLHDRLAASLPAEQKFIFNHVSTPPTKCDPLFAPPPGRKPERTYCESHFLTVSLNAASEPVFIFAIELLVYTTRRLTTLFVSKADSTGAITSLQLPKGFKISPIRAIASTFVSWLAENRTRPNIRLVVSLFARAQNQYLFPNSVDNPGKHVLDDRQLVRWWCKTLDPVLRRTKTQQRQPRSQPDGLNDPSVRAYVIVPGFDKHETSSFFPPSWRTDPVDQQKWRYGHPLHEIASEPSAPPRCLVPRFPDDPKARYVDELDEEIPDTTSSQSFSSPSKRGNGMWKSIKTLEQFWEMMAFRQECSSGRLVGFIWVVFTNPEVFNGSFCSDDTGDSQTTIGSPTHLSDDIPSISQVMSQHEADSPQKRRKRTKLTGPIIPRQPKIKSSSSSVSMTSQAETSPYWIWPETSRGQVVLDTGTYTRVHDLLLRLEFENNDAATRSTKKWIDEVGVIAGTTSVWGQTVTGTLQETAQTASMSSEAPKTKCVYQLDLD